MNQKPVAISLLLCEQIIVDEKTRNATPVNCFNARKLETIPGRATFYALAWLTDGMGDMRLELVVQRMDSLDAVFRLERNVKFAHPLDEMRCAVKISNCPLPVPGSYDVSLLIDRELIAHRKFTVMKKGE